MININLELLKKYFLQNTKHNVLFNIFGTSEIEITQNDIRIAFNNLLEIIELKKEDNGLYTITSKEGLVEYIVESIYHDLKNYTNDFANKQNFLLFVYLNTAIFLTQFTKDALNILKFYPQSIDKYLNESTKNTINSYVDSNDPRGLIYHFTSKFNLPYDLLIQNKIIRYSYTEPAINKKWQNNYKQKFQPIIFWFYNSIIGKALFLVLYTPKCRYKMEKGGCSGCNLPTVSAASTELNTQNVISQIDNTFDNDLSKKEKESIQELMFSNNGSILDPKTMDIESLKYAVSKAIDKFPNLKKIIFETRIDDYTNIKQLEAIKEIIANNSLDIKIEIAVGFEIFDDTLRNGYYKKGLDKSIFEEKMKVLATLDISLKTYMMYKAVPDDLMDVNAAIQDLNNASEYFSNFIEKYPLKFNLHISPTYLAPGTQLFKEHQNGKYTPPTYTDVERMYNALIMKDNLSYYISMNNEGLGENSIDMDYNKQLILKEKIHKFNINNYK